MEEYQPKLGQMIFGQPHQEIEASNMMIAALSAIDDELQRVMWNVHQKDYNSPFANTSEGYKNTVFEVEAYSWGDERQPYNFKYKEIEVSWYKWFGRGTSVNKKVSPSEISEMLDACLNSFTICKKCNHHIDSHHGTWCEGGDKCECDNKGISIAQDQ